uniref:Uncharacterized protein n=1 Tax=viral metagenome TaxID=1070528 RepID=A0A6C0EJX1_9ZZZZ
MSNTPKETVVSSPNKKPDGEWTYALLQETNGEECESWYYFIRFQGNEEALAHLEKQIDSVNWYMLDDLSTFVIETQYLVSERTAKEMTKVDLNPTSFHRKFDGKLEMIDLGLKDSYKTEKKMLRVFDTLGNGKIERYIDREDIDPEDLVDCSDSDSESGSGSESAEDSSDEEDKKKKHKKTGKLPGALGKQSMPRFARAKQHRRKK